MLKRQGSHYAPMRKGWLLAVGLVVVGGAAVAGGLRGGPDGGRVQLRTVTTVAHSPLDVEPTTTTNASDGADGVTAVADDDAARPSQERARTLGKTPVGTTRPPSASATTTRLTTTTLDPDAAEEAREAEEQRLEDEEEAREDAEREARRNAD